MHVAFWKFPAKLTKHFVFFFVKVKPFVLFFPWFLKRLCFLDRSCNSYCRCHVTLVILLFSKERIQWDLNLLFSICFDTFSPFFIGKKHFFLGITLFVKRTSSVKKHLFLDNHYSFLDKSMTVKFEHWFRHESLT